MDKTKKEELPSKEFMDKQHKEYESLIREKQKYNVPLYDPQTGEPNPLYEKLTGDKNPLIELRQNCDFILKPDVYEPKRNNRWKVIFPFIDNVKINSWVFTRTQRPSFKIIDKKILGFIKIGKEVKLNDISFEFIDPIGPSTSSALFNIIQKHFKEDFSYKLEMLDPTGVVIEKWSINGCKIVEINFGELDYANDGLVKCFMTIKPGSVKLLY